MQRYDPGGHFVVGGGTLNQIVDRLAALEIIEGPGYAVDKGPTGRRLRLARVDPVPPRPWDLVRDATDKLLLFAPRIYPVGNDVEGADEIVNNAFEPVAGRWLWVRREAGSPPGPWVVGQGTTWDGFPSPFKFAAESPHALQVTTFPVWRFYADDGDGRVRLGDDVFGEKLVRSEVLRGVPALAKVPGVSLWRAVAYLL